MLFDIVDILIVGCDDNGADHDSTVCRVLHICTKIILSSAKTMAL